MVSFLVFPQGFIAPPFHNESAGLTGDRNGSATYRSCPPVSPLSC